MRAPYLYPKTQCEHCDVEFRPTHKGGRFCSRKCSAQHRTYPRGDVSARFWRRVDKRSDDECWNWTGAKHKSGHARMRVGSRKDHSDRYEGCHRLAWVLTVGPVPLGMAVCHHCDNPACCNPKHLFIGSLADNNRDRHRKGRTVLSRGEAHGNAKLTSADVVLIRSLRAGGVPFRRLARVFSVDPKQIMNITRRLAWVHVP